MVEYTQILGMPKDNVLENILALYRNLFQSEADVYGMKTKRNLVTFLALQNGEPAGFKMGYERNESQFYSWLGGVAKPFRNQGVASELMKRQHEWCRQNGYRTVRTHTKNKWKSMLILNLQHGFDIIGTYTNQESGTKIMLEKRIY